MTIRANGDDGAACIYLVLIVVSFLLWYPQFHKGAGDTSRFRCLPCPLAHERLQEADSGGSLAPHSDLIVSKPRLPQCMCLLFRERGVSKDADRERIFRWCHEPSPLKRYSRADAEERQRWNTPP